MSDVHPACELSVEERVAYLTAVASVACADHVATDAELAKVRDLCGALEVDEAATERVVASARAADHDQVIALVAKYRSSPLRLTLLTDAMVMCFADGKVEAGEAQTISRFAGELGLNTAETVLVGRYVEDVLQGRGEEESLSQDLAVQLSAIGGTVPKHGLIKALFGRFRRK